MSVKNARNGRRWSRSVLAVAAGACLAGVVYAQSTTGNIYGTVPAGTTVTITSSIGVARTVTAGPDGRFNVGSLPAGDYKVEAKGLGARDVTVTVGGGTDASFAGGVQTITVSGSKIKTIDVSQVDTRTVFTADVLSKIAVGQSVNEVALLAPGVVNSTSYNRPLGATNSNNNPLGRSGSGNIGSFGGGAASENAYYINGFPVTNPLTNMGATSLGFDSISQVQVLTGGYGAEYGRSTGGVLSIITKRGTNELKGGVYAIWSPKSLKGEAKDLYFPDTGHWSQANHYNTTQGNNSANWTDGTMQQSRSKNTLDSLTYGAYVGAPIIRDKLFVYVNVEETRNQANGVRQETVCCTRVQSLTATNAAQGWSESTNTYPRATVKLDWNITDNHLLEFTGVQDNAKEKYAYFGFDYPSQTHNGTKFNGDHVLDDQSNLGIIKYTGNLTENLTLSALIGQQRVKHKPDPLPGYDASRNYVTISPTTVPAAFASITSPQAYQTVSDPSEDKTKGYRFDLQYVLGKHDLRLGYDRFEADSSIGNRNTGPNAFRWVYGLKGTPTEAIDASHGVGAPATAGGLGSTGYYVDQFFSTSGGTVSTLQKAVYIEDRWQVMDNVLLSLGLRNDSFTNFNGDKQAYVEQKNNRGPRIGAVWDLKGDKTLKVFGNVGRYFLALPNNVAIRGANASLNSDKYYTYDSIAADGTPVGLHAITPTGTNGICPTGTVGAGSVSSNLECGNAPDPATVAIVNLKPHYQDEFIVGLEQALTKQLSWGAKMTYRDLKSAIDDTCPSECRIFNPGQAATFKIPNGDGTYTLQDYTAEELGFPKLKRKYFALDLFTEYQDGRWYGKVEYTWSKNNGNAEGQLNSSVDTGTGGQADVSVTSDWDLPEIMQGSDGKLPNNRAHQFKLFGFYKFTDEWAFGGSAIIQSGRPRSCTSFYPYAKAGLYNSSIYYHYCGVPGAQTAVNNPNVTPDAGYAFSPRGTMGETPWTKTFNVSATYTPVWAKGLMLKADILNVFNTQTPTTYYEASATTNNRATANARYGQVLYYTDPRTVRFTARYDF